MKTVFVVLVISVTATQGILFLLDEKLGLSASGSDSVPEARAAGQAREDADVLTEAILAGDDPTAVGRPTAAGRSPPITCRTGRIDMPENTHGLDGDIYIARTLGEKTYIQVSPFAPTYLVQDHYQMVTASRLERFPDEVAASLHEAFMMIGHCDVQPLHLSSVHMWEK